MGFFDKFKRTKNEPPAITEKKGPNDTLNNQVQQSPESLAILNESENAKDHLNNHEQPDDYFAKDPLATDKDHPSTLWGQFKKGFEKTSSQLNQRLSEILNLKKIDQDTLQDLEDLLILSDMGPAVAQEIVQRISKEFKAKSADLNDIKNLMAKIIEEKLKPFEQILNINDYSQNKTGPCVILVAGVNGAGKTTSIGKLTKLFQAMNKLVHLAAADTFRAAAVEQLEVWAKRNSVVLYKADQNGSKKPDPAALVYDSYLKAQAAQADILLIDTAGRLHTKTDLMGELEKIIRVLKKVAPQAPHHTLLVLDATVGQNAISQVENFNKSAHITGLIVTKLDGTAKGGIIVQLACKFNLPIHYIGVGETINDIQPFKADLFANTLVGIDTSI